MVFLLLTAIENFEQAHRLHCQSTGSSHDMSANSVDQFPMDLPPDGGAMFSPPIARPHLFRSRSRSNSGDSEITRQRFGRQKGMPAVGPSFDGGRPNLLRRRRGKDLKPIVTSSAFGNGHL